MLTLLSRHACASFQIGKLCAASECFSRHHALTEGEVLLSTFMLKKKTTYYVRVRYAGADGYSNWSKVKKVKTK